MNSFDLYTMNEASKFFHELSKIPKLDLDSFDSPIDAINKWNSKYSFVHFVNDKYVIMDDYKKLFDEGAKKLKQIVDKWPSIKFDIHAHTSSPPTRTYKGGNQELSVKRGNAIKQLLLDKYGIPDENIIKVVGHGPDLPICKNDRVDDQACSLGNGAEKFENRHDLFTSMDSKLDKQTINRRVEIVLTSETLKEEGPKKSKNPDVPNDPNKPKIPTKKLTPEHQGFTKLWVWKRLNAKQNKSHYPLIIPSMNLAKGMVNLEDEYKKGSKYPTNLSYPINDIHILEHTKFVENFWNNSVGNNLAIEISKYSDYSLIRRDELVGDYSLLDMSKGELKALYYSDKSTNVNFSKKHKNNEINILEYSGLKQKYIAEAIRKIYVVMSKRFLIEMYLKGFYDPTGTKTFKVKV